MRKLFLLLLLIISSFSYAQVGIGTTTPEALFDIKASSQATPSNTDGILVPRVDAFPTSDPTAAQNGMIVFLTTAIPSFPVGFYYWDNTITTWKKMDTGEDYWKLSGNADTTNGIDFIGTTDARNLEFRVNNVIQTRITGKGQIETLNNGESVYIGEGAGAAYDGSSTQNTFVGYKAGFSNNHGDSNTATGAYALHQNQYGNNNTAIGTYALYSNLQGNNNTASGANALYSNLTGSSNVAYGYNALHDNTGTGK